MKLCKMKTKVGILEIYITFHNSVIGGSAEAKWLALLLGIVRTASAKTLCFPAVCIGFSY